MDAHLDEVGAEGVGGDVLARAAAHHRALALVEAGDRVRFGSGRGILGVDLQHAARDAAQRLGERLAGPVRTDQRAVLQHQGGGVGPSERAVGGQRRGLGDPAARLFAGLVDDV